MTDTRDPDEHRKLAEILEGVCDPTRWINDPDPWATSAMGMGQLYGRLSALALVVQAILDRVMQEEK